MKFRELRAAERDTEEFVEAYLESPLDTTYEVARRHPASPLATVFKSGYTELARLEKLQGARGHVTRGPGRGRDQPARLDPRRRGRTGSSAGSRSWPRSRAPAPFVGLFGTVVGIMNSFESIGASGSASLAVVAPGIAEALVATAVGLFAAIPAAVGYNYSSARLNRLDARLETFCVGVLRPAAAHAGEGGMNVARRPRTDSARSPRSTSRRSST